MHPDRQSSSLSSALREFIQLESAGDRLGIVIGSLAAAVVAWLVLRVSLGPAPSDG